MTTNSLHLQLNTDQELIPREVPSQRVLEISVQPPTAANTTNRPRLNLALVLDRSGSMDGEKLEYVKLAAAHVLDLLQEQDSAALVAYDDEVTLISPAVPLTARNLSQLKNRITRLQSGGSTNLSEGWLTGCREAAAAAQEGTLNRALLLTDGLANAGITELEELARHARELCSRGVSTSTFGVGEGFNEHLLEAMSNQGGGNFYYIEAPGSIPDLFMREFKELAAVTARDVEITLEVPAHVGLQVPGGWRTEEIPGGLRIFVNALYSGHPQEIYVRLLTPPAGEENTLIIRASVRGMGEANQMLEDHAEAVFSYASQAEAAAAPQKRDVLERFARVDLAETANEALKLERKGENEKASRLLKRCLDDNGPYIDPEQAREYRNMADRMKRGMEEFDRKQSHYSTYNAKRRKEL